MLIVDTGPLVATADRADKDHTAYRELLESDGGPRRGDHAERRLRALPEGSQV